MKRIRKSISNMTASDTMYILLVGFAVVAILPVLLDKATIQRFLYDGQDTLLALVCAIVVPLFVLMWQSEKNREYGIAQSTICKYYLFVALVDTAIWVLVFFCMDCPDELPCFELSGAGVFRLLYLLLAREAAPANVADIPISGMIIVFALIFIYFLVVLMAIGMILRNNHVVISSLFAIDWMCYCIPVKLKLRHRNPVSNGSGSLYQEHTTALLTHSLSREACGSKQSMDNFRQEYELYYNFFQKYFATHLTTHNGKLSKIANKINGKLFDTEEASVAGKDVVIANDNDIPDAVMRGYWDAYLLLYPMLHRAIVDSEGDKTQHYILMLQDHLGITCQQSGRSYDKKQQNVAQDDTRMRLYGYVTNLHTCALFHVLLCEASVETLYQDVQRFVNCAQGIDVQLQLLGVFYVVLKRADIDSKLSQLSIMVDDLFPLGIHTLELAEARGEAMVFYQWLGLYDAVLMNLYNQETQISRDTLNIKEGLNALLGRRRCLYGCQ
ncbi:hypothetical protein RFF05_08040 [Bengtsoniella intestinalis]|uniref:hypothetical protein n=1 Tax=Bengtsoniella intestinalis TaxID=3073143 RepID=UPI00391F0C7D